MLILDAKAYDFDRNAQEQFGYPRDSRACLHPADQAEPPQTDRTLPLRDKKDLESSAVLRSVTGVNGDLRGMPPRIAED